MSMENIAGARKPAKREDEHTVAGEHRMMRRADREVTNPEQIAAIVAACDIVEVAYADAEGLTIVPLNFGFDYDEATGKLTLWFHSAPRGRKLDAIRAAAGGRLPVAFTMQTDCEVVAGRTTCNWGEARIQFVSATLVFGLAAFDCSLAISSSHTSLGVL